MVGMTRFERATPSSQAKCATSCATSRRHYIQFFCFDMLAGSLRYLPPMKTIINCFVRQSRKSAIQKSSSIKVFDVLLNIQFFLLIVYCPLKVVRFVELIFDYLFYTHLLQLICLKIVMHLYGF